ncbi:2-hydroxyacid dehydrogenase [Clostridium folliculivorans]|uniref:Bifunctional glyoxylate/hydroxypyruvate reductase B n=1 Tax=Clostridium folliculivorans TaxID=2886038 RepID=A0A9W5Y3L4_9CLOT|nr:D-glycerate dehydrogenase [Clostridium folliculivorans]GKU25915.1 bifunctional glyoxylate/hydroxypyruvate reductase B [Clostridium folliculivorans]GKU28001.1 bifunctional glyoxylate/hydroxypyruvate reductase B [Clostridium folliculivorans]
MSRPKVYIAKPIPQEVEEYIDNYCDLEKWDSDEDITREELLENLKDIDGLLTSGTKIDEELLEKAPNLKVVSNMSVGYNNFDLKAMKDRNIMGTNVAGALDDTVADLIFGLMLACARRITELDRYVKAGKWNRDDDLELYGANVHHRTLGIIGMGRIGEAVAKRASLGFDMNVLYYNRSRKKEVEEKLGAEYCTMEELLKRSDFIVIMTPLTEETLHLIDEEQFNLMKSNAIFINASRGKTINERALIKALQNKKIRAAGLDVFDVEPVQADNPLLKMDNVVTLPHIGSANEDTRLDMARLAAKNLVKALTEGTAPNIVPELKE